MPVKSIWGPQSSVQHALGVRLRDCPKFPTAYLMTGVWAAATLIDLLGVMFALRRVLAYSLAVWRQCQILIFSCK